MKKDYKAALEAILGAEFAQTMYGSAVMSYRKVSLTHDDYDTIRHALKQAEAVEGLVEALRAQLIEIHKWATNERIESLAEMPLALLPGRE